MQNAEHRFDIGWKQSASKVEAAIGRRFPSLKIKEKLLEALRAHLQGESVTWTEPISPQEWAEFFHVATIQKVLPMVYDAVYRCPSMREAGEQVALFYKRQMFQVVIQQTNQTAEFITLYRQLLQAGLKPLVVKGLICRSLYPNPDYRASGDEDVFLRREEYPQCHEVFLANGMELEQPDRDPFQEGEVPYRKTHGLLYIELHKELFPEGSEAYGDLNQLFEGVFDRAIQMDIEGCGIYTMDHTDAFLYLVCHAFKHFMHSGFGIRQVCDLVMYANVFGSQMDWHRILERLREIRADLFTAALLQIGLRYLNFDPQKACYPQEWQEIDVDCEAILEDLTSGGIYGAADGNRQHSSTITLNAVIADKRGQSTKPRVMKSLFPPAKDLAGRYPYLKRKPYLLPLAWGDRIFKYQKELRTQRRDPSETIQIGNRRVALLREYGIIK